MTYAAGNMAVGRIELDARAESEAGQGFPKRGPLITDQPAWAPSAAAGVPARPQVAAPVRLAAAAPAPAARPGGTPGGGPRAIPAPGDGETLQNFGVFCLDGRKTPLAQPGSGEVLPREAGQ